jgi:hypothetical protein
MAALTQTAMSGPGQRAATGNTLTSSDTFTYSRGAGQVLLIFNGSGGALTPTLGSGSATINGDGLPGVSVTTYSIGSISNGASKAVPLDTIWPYLVNNSGTVTLASGTGATAYVLNPTA